MSADIVDTLNELLTSTHTTAVVATTTAILGNASSFGWVNQTLGLVATSIGILACVFLTRLHYLRGQLLSRQIRAFDKAENEKATLVLVN